MHDVLNESPALTRVSETTPPQPRHGPGAATVGAAASPPVLEAATNEETATIEGVFKMTHGPLQAVTFVYSGFLLLVFVILIFSYHHLLFKETSLANEEVVAT